MKMNQCRNILRKNYTTFSLKAVRKLSEKVMNIIYLLEKFFDKRRKLDIIKVKLIVSKM